ncbi:MAG: CDP-diacylglycerol--serine O-phosphatidyltransferase [Alphaproteobacteria bacterium]|nr:CDP-diacylglycerol--serine O-phosphatidyltransferase [Alphaproteobacteria bacterium]
MSDNLHPLRPAPESAQPRRRIVKDLPLTRLLPNMLTLLSLCSGLTGIRFSLSGKWEQAVLAIMVAAVFDVLDGRVARMLNIASKFGAELDSLSDAISFGVAPGFIMYEWALHDAGGFGWVAVLLFAVCCALRLARFNTMLDDHDAPAWAKRYFTGVPAPAGASLALLPMAYVLQFGEAAKAPSALYAAWIIMVGALMVSRMPTFALKGWRIAPIWVAPVLVIAVAVVAGLITNTWLTLSELGTLYVIGLPLGWLSYRARERKEATNG